MSMTCVLMTITADDWLSPRSFREGRQSQGDDVTAVPARHKDLTSLLWLYLQCVCVRVEEDMLSVFMSTTTVHHTVIRLNTVFSVHRYHQNTNCKI